MEKTAMQTVIDAIEKVKTSSLNEYITLVINTNDLNKLLSDALEQEEQQIIDAFDKGLENWDSELTAEQYYSQTYTG